MGEGKRKLKRKGFLVGFFICLFLAIPYFALMIVIAPNVVDADDTKECYGTVDNVEQDEKDYLITVDEFSFKIFIDHEIVIDENALNNLSKGEKIYFRVNSATVEMIFQGVFVEQVAPYSLRTDETDLVTLESYNQDIAKETLIAKIATGCLSCVLFILSAVFLTIYIKRKKAAKTIVQE